jgi:hypothetical protein
MMISYVTAFEAPLFRMRLRSKEEEPSLVSKREAMTSRSSLRDSGTTQARYSTFEKVVTQRSSYLASSPLIYEL